IPLLIFSLLFSLRLPLPPCSTLFPYTTLFRSVLTVLQQCQEALGHSSRSRPLFPSEEAKSYFAHESAFVDENVEIGEGTSIWTLDRKSTRLNSSHGSISYAVFCLKKKRKTDQK